MSSEATTTHYVKIWAILLGLLVVSVCGPMLEIKWLTLITAFGIAVVKAIMVAKHFMHLSVERRFIVYMLSGMLLLMFVFFFGIAVDIMMPAGSNWQKLEVPTLAPAEPEEAAHHH
jgi:caa(3)-type oxidase subunit IV